MRAVGAAALALVLAGCGSSSTGHGRATLWVTRDRGAHVLLVRTVAAGQSAIAALEQAAKVKTGYGGRFVQAIDGIEGSLSSRRDWFYFVNGYEADVGAADYTLHPGDVEWWDYRSWAKQMRVPVVVGAFPEPFLHGYGGKRRRTVVVGGAGAGAVARAIRGSLHRPGTLLPRNVNVIRLAPGRRTSLRARLTGDSPGAPVHMEFYGDWRQLLAGRFRYRYSVP
ncbi:MAG: DUF4430 domain-containing protein [Gaiellaceae bacterium]